MGPTSAQRAPSNGRSPALGRSGMDDVLTVGRAVVLRSAGAPDRSAAAAGDHGMTTTYLLRQPLGSYGSRNGRR